MKNKQPKKTITQMNIEICQAMIDLMNRIAEEARTGSEDAGLTYLRERTERRG